MDKKLQNPRWILRDEMGTGEHGVRTLEFTSDSLVIWITRSAVIVYDLENAVGYAAVFNIRTNIFEGEYRYLNVHSDKTFYEPDHTTRLWITASQKQRLLDLLRKAISYRSRQFAPDYEDIWTSAFREALTLSIQNEGQVKYFPKFIPGIG